MRAAMDNGAPASATWYRRPEIRSRSRSLWATVVWRGMSCLDYEAVLRRCQAVLEERRGLLEKFPDQYGINLLAEDGLTWSKYPLDLRAHDDILDLAVNPILVSAAAQYLDEVPVLTSIQIYCTTDRKSIAGNNYYHFDKDFRQVKFWMAINEIKDETGPFTCIDATKSKLVRAKAGYYGRLQDERVYAAVPEEARIEFKGPPGSMMLVRYVQMRSLRVPDTKRSSSNACCFNISRLIRGSKTCFYYQPVLYNIDRYENNPLARLVFAQMHEKVAGKR